jgi:O-antigen ligase
MQRDTSMQESQSFRVDVHRLALGFGCFSIPLERADVFGLGIDFLLTKIALTAYLGISLISRRQALSLRIPAVRIIVLYMLYLVVITRVHAGESTSYSGTLIYLNILFFVVVANHLSRKPELRDVACWSFIGASVVLSLFGLAEGTGASEGTRLSAFGDNPNNVGINLAVACLMALGLLRDGGQRRQWRAPALYLTLAIIVPTLLMTGSRVAFLSLVIGLAVHAAVWHVSSPAFRLIARVSLSLLFVAGLGFFTASLPIFERVSDTLQTGDVGNRDYLLSIFVPIALEAPVFGVGLSGFASRVTDFVGDQVSPHNGLIEVFIYTGLVGIALFLPFLASVTRGAWYWFRQQDDTAPLTLLAPVFGILLTGQIFQLKALWLVLAIATHMKQESVPSFQETESAVR